MADFCQQCSIENWGTDIGDLASLENPSEEVYLYTLCEGCGPTIVDKAGKCIGNCWERHGILRVQTFTEYVDGKTPT